MDRAKRSSPVATNTSRKPPYRPPFRMIFAQTFNIQYARRSGLSRWWPRGCIEFGTRFTVSLTNPSSEMAFQPTCWKE